MLDLKVAQASSLVFEDNIRNCQLFFRCTAERDWATTAFTHYSLLITHYSLLITHH
jgi:hypothetical protein